MQRPSSRFIILKFGGTSVASKKRWDIIMSQCQARLEVGFHPVIVCSAVAGISNTLEKIVACMTDNQNVSSLLQAVKDVHVQLALEMGLDAHLILDDDFKTLERLIQGASLLGEVSPKTHANIMAFGELMATKLGAAYMNANGLPIVWQDVRNYLRSTSHDHANQQRTYLTATCSFDADLALQHAFAQHAPAIITQGFIARNSLGHTVLLGRGGSDTSAAYLAAKLAAERCEIWTDVPGMYTANPRQVAEARMLVHLDYNEAQEIATMGAKVLHPRCLAPVKMHRIPLEIRCTQAPNMPGTQIAQAASNGPGKVKSISTKSNITLISVENIGMWHEIGFLADLFACFKNHGLSIDLVSTAETNVTISLDPLTNALNRDVLENLLQDLKSFGKVQVIAPCAVISLVGRNIRSILHQLGPALQVFEEHKIYLMSQAASDLNLSFVVSEDDADRLLKELHRLLFENAGSDPTFGDAWSEAFAQQTLPEKRSNQWWHEKRDILLSLMKGTMSPLYVYDEKTLIDTAIQLSSFKSLNRLFYAIKANDNPQILKIFHNLGLNFECVSSMEVQHVLTLFPDIDRRRILFTPNFAPKSEYEAVFQLGCFVTLDNLYPLEAWPDLLRGKDILLRLDPGQGRGHHHHVQTAGEQSKFGISLEQIGKAAELVQRANANVIGVHAHAGSGISRPNHWVQMALFLAEVAESFPSVKILNLGGGLFVPSKLYDDSLDIQALDSKLLEIRDAYPQFELWLEPGRFLVANAGVLLAHVTQLKTKGATRFIGVNTGMNSLIRPALYGAYHHIVNLSRLDEPLEETANVVGPICESGDTLGYSRKLPKTKEGDVLLIATVGAYGHVMSSSYNRRTPAEERFIE